MSMFTMMRALVLGSDELELCCRGTAAVFTRTPLDMIQMLERTDLALDAVVLAGEFARRDDIAAFLRESYPQLAIHHDAGDVAA